MPKIIIDVIGLAVIDVENDTAMFLNDPKPQIVGEATGKSEAVPAHFAFVAMQIWQHETKDAINPRFRFYNEPTSKRKFGIRGWHSWYLLSRDNGKPQRVEVLDVESSGVAASVEPLLSVSEKLVPAARLRDGVLSGESDLIAALLNIKDANITAIEDDQAKLGVKDQKLPSVQVVRLEYKTGPKPRLVLRRGAADPITFDLDDGAHLIAGVVPIEELVGLQEEPSPNDLMKHFDLIYQMFDIPAGTDRPIPKHLHDPDLGPPGQCGPPVRP